ncbi:hypothetical protein SOVF_107290, partial [Spinacia oleracea]
RLEQECTVGCWSVVGAISGGPCQHRVHPLGQPP